MLGLLNTTLYLFNREVDFNHNYLSAKLITLYVVDA